MKLNFSHIRAIEKNVHNGGTPGTDGYGSPFWKSGEKCYQDINVQHSKRFSRAFHLNLVYMNQYYNKTVVEGEGGFIHSNVFVVEGKYKFSPQTTLRTELQ